MAVLLLQAVSTAATLYLPSLNAKIIDEGVARGDVDYIWDTGLLMLGVAFIQVIAAVIATWFGARAAMGLGRDVRAEVFGNVSDFSAEDMARFGAPTLITRATNDVQQVQMVFLMMLNFMVAMPIMCIGGIIMAIREDAGMSWLVWASVAVLLGVVGALISRLLPMFTQMQGKLDAINGIVREQITGIRVVRAFAREDYETKRFTSANEDITDISVRIGRIFVLMFPIIVVILNAATGAVLWFGGHRVEAGIVNIGALTAFLQYLLQILVAVMMGTFMAMMLPRAIICARRITEVLSHAPSIEAPATAAASQAAAAASVAPGECAVEFDNVTFTYAGAEAPVLKNVSFTARPGETTAIIGSTGSGKTTLLSLIPRLHAPTSGRVLLGGDDVAHLDRGDIVQRVSMVPQKPYLFSGTVASNLRLGRPEATDQELWDALEIAQANFVGSLDMEISQGGTNISGGQRQRLSIARMLVARPSVYLFDDSFSALDVTTDANVRAALRTSLAKRAKEENVAPTVLIVAQRVASIMDADSILVMEEGEIVARGTHAELLDSSPTYQEIVQSQMNAEVNS